MNMLMTEWNLDDAKEVWFEEGKEEGIEKGREEEREHLLALLDEGLSVEEIKKRLTT
jgi:predicted transposase YdaD